MATKIFPGVIFAETTGYSINFPDVPGAHSEGDTIEECLAMGQEVLNLALEALADDKKEIPEASNALNAMARALETYPEGSIYTVQLMTGTIPERVQKYTITMDPELMKRVDADAGNYGRSGWLADAARLKLAGAVSSVQFSEYIAQRIKDADPESAADAFAEGLNEVLKDQAAPAPKGEPARVSLFGRYRSLTARKPTDTVVSEVGGNIHGNVRGGVGAGGIQPSPGKYRGKGKG